MRDITDSMPDFCDRCCHDDPINRPSSIRLLESLPRRMRREQNVSSFVVEALHKDTDSTFWDYPLIERILEAGADPDLVGPDRLIDLDMSNKSDQDVRSICQLLSKYGVSPGIELEPSTLPDTRYQTPSPASSPVKMELSSQVAQSAVQTVAQNLCLTTPPDSIDRVKNTLDNTLTPTAELNLSLELNKTLVPFKATIPEASYSMRNTVACWHCVLQRDKVSILCSTFTELQSLIALPVRARRCL
jgi:hypothetical protein